MKNNSSFSKIVCRFKRDVMDASKSERCFRRETRSSKMNKTPIDIFESVVIVVENKEYKCNRRKLAQESPYFKVLLYGNFVERNLDKIVLKEVSKKGFENVLNILDENFKNTYENLIAALQCGCMLLFDSVVRYCITFLNVDVNNCLDLWQICELFEIHPLLEKAKYVAFLNFNTVKNSKYFKLLQPKNLHSYLASDLIAASSELDIFKAGMNWLAMYKIRKLQELKPLTEDEVTRLIFMILSCIDFHDFTIDDVRKIINVAEINNNDIVKNVLEEIFLFYSVTSIGNYASLTVNDFRRNLSRNAQELLQNSRRKNPYICVLSVNQYYSKNLNLLMFDTGSNTHQFIFSETSNFSKLRELHFEGNMLLPYKENLLLIGGVSSVRAPGWNKKIWIYYTVEDKWKTLTVMPKKRRHFIARIVENKLCIMGGTGTFRITHNNTMMVYDFRTDLWKIDIRLPVLAHHLNVYVHNKKLILISRITFDSLEAHIYDENVESCWRTVITGVNSYIAEMTLPKSIILFWLYGLEPTDRDERQKAIESSGSARQLSPLLETGRTRGSVIHLINNNVYVFSRIIKSFEYKYVMDCFNFFTDQEERLMEIGGDESPEGWLITTGCFKFFSYQSTRNHNCISKFRL